MHKMSPNYYEMNEIMKCISVVLTFTNCTEKSCIWRLLNESEMLVPVVVTKKDRKKWEERIAFLPLAAPPSVMVVIIHCGMLNVRVLIVCFTYDARSGYNYINIQKCMRIANALNELLYQFSSFNAQMLNARK